MHSLRSSHHLLRRKHNFDRLRAALADIEDKVILPVPCENSRPSWFGFLITVKEGIDRKAVVEYVESHGVQTRNLLRKSYKTPML